MNQSDVERLFLFYHHILNEAMWFNDMRILLIEPMKLNDNAGTVYVLLKKNQDLIQTLAGNIDELIRVYDAELKGRWAYDGQITESERHDHQRAVEEGDSVECEGLRDGCDDTIHRRETTNPDSNQGERNEHSTHE